MKRSSSRFLTSHMGGLPRSPDLTAMLTAKDAGQPYDKDALAERVKGAVSEVVRLQVENGIDIVNDGELSKFSWAAYFADRLDGLERKPGQARAPITAREQLVFPEWFKVAGPG
jgi:5-methyltetrahydropteroyltriglutamate--homocysteine methyltransferase